MKQGTEYVYVKLSIPLVKEMKGEWSPPVQVKLDESYDGDIELITRAVADQSLRELAKSL